MTLSSLQNPKIKRLRSLHQRKARQQERAFLLETTRLVEEAQQSGWPIEELFVTEHWAERYPELLRGAHTVVAEELLPRLVSTETPEGVVAIARMREDWTLPPVVPQTLWVVADGLQDPGNLGTLIRTADAAGASAVLIGPGTVDPYSPKVVRGTMGSLFHLPVLMRPDVAEDLRREAGSGMKVLATTLEAERSLYQVDLSGSVAWLIGNEGAGLSDAARAIATDEVRIPMPGKAESLNAAVAAAVCLFETVRQRLI